MEQGVETTAGGLLTGPFQESCRLASVPPPSSLLDRKDLSRSQLLKGLGDCSANSYNTAANVPRETTTFAGTMNRHLSAGVLP